MQSKDDADVPAGTGTSLIEQFARHRVAANLLMIMMILAGAWGVSHIHTQLNPPQTPPEVWIDVTWPGASAEDVEGRVAIPVEQSLRGLRDMRELHSRSRPGRADVWVEFDHDADLPTALDSVKQAVANIRNLPTGIEPPQVRLGYNQELIASVLLTGPGRLEELIPLARDFERDLLARGIEAIEVDGLPDQELRIMVASRTLTAAGTTLGDLATEVRRLSADVPAGTVGRAQGPRALRSLDQQRSVRGFEGLFVAFGGDLVRLGDLAEIDVQSRDDAIEVTHGGQPAIELYLMRTGDGDALEMAEIMNGWLAEVRPTLPEGVELHVMKEAWSWIAEQLSVLLANGLSGLLLVMAVLLVFLSGRVAAWVAVGIPVSFALALAIYWGAFDGRIQIVSLIAFIMALGIVVDDAIVVSEDAVTQFEGGKSPREAAIAGARRMFVPVMTSSLTTLAAFAPLMLFGGPMGEAILALPTVLLCIILASLVECFLVLPHHLAGSLARSKRGEESRFRRAVDARFDAFRERFFRPLLQRALDWPGATVCTALAAVLIAFALVASQRVGVNFITNLDMESVEAAVQFAGGTSKPRKDAFLDEIETALTETRDEFGAENIVGWTTKTNYTRIEQERRYGPEYAWVEAEYAPAKARSAAPQAFVDAWRERIEVPPWVEVFELRAGGGSNGGNADLTLRLRGRDATNLKSAAIELAEVLRGYEGVTNVTDDMPWGREQWIFVLGPAGRAAGLTPDELGRQLRSAYSGERVQIFNRADEELEVRVMLPELERSDLASLRRFPVRLRDGAMVPLGSVARLEARRGIDEIRRMDGELAVRVHAWVDASAGNAFEITGDVRERHLPGIEQRWDVVSGLSGQSEQDAMMMQTFAAGFLLTFVFIYLILAWVFSSWTWPVAIMTAIPFGLTGAIFGHWVMGMDFGVMSILAFFALTGVVVNDSIVLTSFLRRHHDAGMPFREALELAATQRLRAVLMTSMTTCAGLAPLMFEPSSLALYIAPIAITIVFGLAFATALVLLVVPALLLRVDAGSNGLRSAATGAWNRLLERLPAGAAAPRPAARLATNETTSGGTPS